MPRDIPAFLWSILLMPERGWRKRVNQALEKKLSEGLSLREVAKLCKTSHTHLQNIANGKFMPKMDTLENIAEGLGVSFGWIYYGREMDREFEEILHDLAELDPDVRDAFLRMARSQRRRSSQ